jgi:hypothetical protein
MKMVRVIQKYDNGFETIHLRPWVPGMIIDCDDPKDVTVIEVPEVPDSDHQSSLDYLKGV